MKSLSMDVELREIPVREVLNGYVNNGDDGVVGYGGRLNIRPKYQRNFVYKEAQREAVLHTILNGLPLNTMYWAVRDDGGFEIIDGQQRTMSIAEYVNSPITIDVDGTRLGFANLSDEVQNRILDYKLMIYLCKGTWDAKIAWFKTVNTAGATMTNQEIRNAVFSKGDAAWLADAKRHFSKNGGPAHTIGNKHVKGDPVRQEYLETVLRWITDGTSDGIEDYMATHQHDEDAKPLWDYYRKVIDWIHGVFGEQEQEGMKGNNWGKWYRLFEDQKYDREQMILDVKELLKNAFVSNNKGVYPYLLSRRHPDYRKYLSLRVFKRNIKEAVWKEQEKLCARCGKGPMKQVEMEADHIKRWVDAGPTIQNNCQMLCKTCHNDKTKEEASRDRELAEEIEAKYGDIASEEDASTQGQGT